MALAQRIEIKGGAYYERPEDGGRFMVPLNFLKCYENNPRDPVEFDYNRNNDFRALVDSIITTGGINHTPISVYYSQDKYHVIAGHRRIAAVKKANELSLEGWLSGSKLTPKPKTTDFIYATPRNIPGSDFQRRMMMFPEEETSKPWGDVRKFAFFRDMFLVAPDPIKADRQELCRITSLPSSTINTYIDFINNQVIGNAMADPSEIDFPRGGRKKTLRACVKGVETILNSRSSIVKTLTGFEIVFEGGSKAKQLLSELFLKKAKLYNKKRIDKVLSIGAGVAMERTLPELRVLDDGKTNVTNAEITNWLNTDSILLQDTIQQTKRDNILGGTVYEIVQKIPVRNRLSSSPEDLINAADDWQSAADICLENARTIRSQYRKVIHQ